MPLIEKELSDAGTANSIADTCPGNKLEMANASRLVVQIQAVMKRILVTFVEQMGGVQAIACAAKQAILIMEEFTP